MKVRVEHTTRFEYAADVVESVIDVRLGPRSDEHQRWGRFDIRVDPAGSVRRYGDGFGNTGFLVTLARAHRHLDLRTAGEIETLLADPFALPAQLPDPLGPSALADFLDPSPLVPLVPGLGALAGPHRPTSGEDTFAAVQRLMHLVNERLEYVPGVTTVETTVVEVLGEPRGVCQDFAHLLIGLCRSVAIPARYVSGYTVADASGPARGAGASHAWVEAFTPTHGWRGFDPTNDLVASGYHVKVAIGRDYGDVPPHQGTYRGQAEELLSVKVATAVA
ncbi:MAG: transglutaminase family protein [Chloroflexota bacterium]|nr:transglutaminase family protein [Chloroflexota bacterium]